MVKENFHKKLPRGEKIAPRGARLYASFSFTHSPVAVL